VARASPSCWITGVADDVEEPPLDDDNSGFEDDADDLDDAEIFVEVKTARFLRAVGLPVLDELPSR
jgi:hypothetical protein